MIVNRYPHFPLFILLHIHHLNAVFSPDTTDFDAYGIKIAINHHLLVLAQNNQQPPSFFIQFSPSNQTLTSSSSSSSLQCSIRYPNITNTFIYTVALGRKQNQTQTHFFFLGEHTNDQDGTFIGIATFNQSSNSTTPTCNNNNSFSYSLQYFDNYQHQEYVILGVHPYGTLAYAFSNSFVAVFDPQNSSTLNIWNGNLTWSDASFIPHAVDINKHFGVVAGFIRNQANATAKYSPMIYLINFNSSDHSHPFVIDQYRPIPTPSTWQDLLTYTDADVYSAKYDMSVSIDEQGNVLVGMQFINRVFLLSVNITNPSGFTYVSRYTNGRSLGNGKSIAWFDNGIAAILINVYSLDYEWSLSQIFFFDIYKDGYNSTTTPLSVFPNSHQMLPSSFSSVFLAVVSSPTSLALLDDQGKILIFSPTAAEFYPVVQVTGVSPFVTTPQACMAGAFKNKIGVYDCVLCSRGTKNPGNSSVDCVSCSNGSFCPLGSVADVSQSALESRFQVLPYPRSPESTIFDEILIHNMFSIGPGRCLLVSPLFWALIVASIVIIIIIIMEILKLCVESSRGMKIRHIIKRVFRHTDLIGEGEFWIGGLISFSLIVLVSFAYAFSSGYLKQYPIETASDSYFACDQTIRNAKFETNVQSLAIPFTDTEQEMFDLLNNQAFTLILKFVNTLVSCDAISIEAQFGLVWSTIRWLDCNNTDAILTLTVPLPYQHIAVQVFLADTKTMGAIRIGLTGPEHESSKYKLKELNFIQSYWKDDYVLSRTLPVAIAITKVINETKPMEGEESDFSGIYIPTFTVDMNSLFISNDQYVRSALTLTTLTIVISETPYYVKNLQEPIVRESEVIFRNLLFTVVCLEIFCLVFLLYKLALKPLYHSITRKYRGNSQKETSDKAQTNGYLQARKSLANTSGIYDNHISSTF